MKTNLFKIFILVIFFTFSCSKEESSNSSGTGGNPSNPSTCNFAPYRIGSKLEVVFKGDTSYIECTKDTFINSNKYIVQEHNKYSKNAYFRIDSLGNVWEYMPQYSIYGTSNFTTELIRLKPNENVGSSWFKNLSIPQSQGINDEIKLTFKIKQKNITRTINGNTYNNCILVNNLEVHKNSGIEVFRDSMDILWICGYGYYSILSNGSDSAIVTKFTY
jgi:hypothetical protein